MTKGYSEASGIPFAFAFYKNSYIGRTFIKPTQEERESSVHLKLSVLESVVTSADTMLRDEPSNVFVSELQDSAIELGARIWVKNEDYWNTKWQLTEEIKTEFDKIIYEIPFPQMDVNIQKRSIDSDF